jgi:glutathione S-transferase
MTDYTLIGHPRSRAFRPLWMLEELGLPYTHHAAQPHAAEVQAANPTGKIPVLIADGVAICDSSAILTYLADRHDQLTFAPGTLDRARQDAWMFRLLDELDAVLWAAARHSFVLPEAERVPAVKDSLKTEFARNAERIAGELGKRPFVMGDRLTLPDIVLAHCLGWAMVAKFPPLPEGLQTYLGAMRARPAYLRAAGG